MGDLYASAIGTTVLQLKEIPPRPKEFDGECCLFGLKGGEPEIQAALSKFGNITSCKIGPRMTIVRFDTHEAAREARRAAPQLTSLCDAIDTHFNERSYDGRKGETGRDDDFGRGWCCFESSISSELLVRLHANPKMRAALANLPHKMIALSSEKDAQSVDLDAMRLEGRVEDTVTLLQRATFTGKGDSETVPALYKGVRRHRIEYAGSLDGELDP